MKRIKFLLLVFVVTIPFLVHAEDKYFNAGDIVKDIGNITHNYFSVGNSIKNEMDIDGILFTAGNNIDYSGKTEYAFIAGNTIGIKGTIEKDLFVAGNIVNITEETILGRDLYAAAKSITISTNLEGNAYLGAAEIVLDTEEINGDRLIVINSLTINGTLKYNDNIVIEGMDKITASEIIKYANNEASTEDSVLDTIREAVLSITSLIIVAYLINLFLPKIYAVDDKLETKEILKRIGVGFLTLICIPIASIIAIITVIGFPVGIIALLSYGVMIYTSIIFASKFIGVEILKRFNKNNIYAALAIGIVLIKLIKLIPVCGGLVYLLCMLYGLGSFYKIFKKRRTAK